MFDIHKSKCRPYMENQIQKSLCHLYVCNVGISSVRDTAILSVNKIFFSHDFNFETPDFETPESYFPTIILRHSFSHDFSGAQACRTLAPAVVPGCKFLS